MSINRILSQLNQRGVSLSSRYDITIGRINGLPNTQGMSFACEQCSFPSKSYQTQERMTHGPTIKLPTNKLYNDVTLTFRCDSAMREKTFFDQWYDLVSDGRSHIFNYYDNYVTSVVISQLNQKNQETYRIELEEAYPVEIGAIDLSAAAKDTINKFTVNLTYKHWRPIGNNVGNFIDFGQININQGIR